MLSERTVIAVIDDDGVIREAVDRLLRGYGYRTELYESAEEFIGTAITSEARCLIVDIQLGDITGIDLGRHLVQAGLDFPIIFLTGEQDEITRRQAADLGCVAYLNKPFPIELLMDAINQAIERDPDRR